jgi:signal transduction histidine kinase
MWEIFSVKKEHIMKTVLTTMLVVLALCASMLVGSAQAGEKEDAVKMVKAAASYLQANGLEKALDALNDPKGEFVKGDLYVFAYDENGTMMSNVNKPSLVGQNIIDVPDANGKKFRREIIERAKKGEAGWVDYVTLHPKTKVNEQKTTYFEKAGDLILGCGIYKK